MLLQMCLSWLLATSITTDQIACREGGIADSYSSLPIMSLSECNSLNLIASSDGYYWSFGLPSDPEYRCLVVASGAPYCLIAKPANTAYDFLIEATGKVAAITAYGVAIENEKTYFSITRVSTYLRLPSNCEFTISVSINVTTNFIRSLQLTESVSTPGTVNSFTLLITPLTNKYPLSFLYENPQFYISALYYSGKTELDYQMQGLALSLNINVFPSTNVVTVVSQNYYLYTNGQNSSSINELSNLEAVYMGTYSTCESTAAAAAAITNPQFMSYIDWQNLLSNSINFPIISYASWDSGYYYLALSLRPGFIRKYLLQDSVSASFYNAENPVHLFGSYATNILLRSLYSNTPFFQTITISSGSSIYVGSLTLTNSGVKCNLLNFYGTDIWANLNVKEWQNFVNLAKTLYGTITLQTINGLSFVIQMSGAPVSVTITCDLPSEIRYSTMFNSLTATLNISAYNIQTSISTTLTVAISDITTTLTEGLSSLNSAIITFSNTLNGSGVAINSTISNLTNVLSNGQSQLHADLIDLEAVMNGNQENTDAAISALGNILSQQL